MILLILTLSATNAENALKIIWNTQTQACRNTAFPVDVTQYGMLENSDPGSTGWQGEVITILYQHSGSWPFRVKKTGVDKDGVLPQVPNDDFDGLVQDCSNSSALAMELLQSYTKLSRCSTKLIICRLVLIHRFETLKNYPLLHNLQFAHYG